GARAVERPRRVAHAALRRHRGQSVVCGPTRGGLTRQVRELAALSGDASVPDGGVVSRPLLAAAGVGGLVALGDVLLGGLPSGLTAQGGGFLVGHGVPLVVASSDRPWARRSRSAAP